MKDIAKKITYNGKDYLIVFNLNVMQEIQEKYGTIQKWGDLTDGGETGEPNAKAVIVGFTAMINEGIDIMNEENGTKDKPLTQRQVGRMITEIGLAESAKTLQNAVIESTKSTEKNA
jgi:hypothetical protein